MPCAGIKIALLSSERAANKLNATLFPGTILIVSPHLDDAVFSCGELMAQHAGAIVVTVFSAAPPAFNHLTAWDATCGFQTTAQAVASRRFRIHARSESRTAKQSFSSEVR